MLDGLREVLQQIPSPHQGLVLRGSRGGRVKADTVRTVFIREVISLLTTRFRTPPGAIGFASGRLHSMRHYFCSLAANNGIPEQVVMNWLGHSDCKMVRHYYHLYDAESQQQMRRLPFAGPSGGGAGDVSPAKDH